MMRRACASQGIAIACGSHQRDTQAEKKKKEQDELRAAEQKQAQRATGLINVQPKRPVSLVCQREREREGERERDLLGTSILLLVTGSIHVVKSYWYQFYYLYAVATFLI